MEQKKIAVIGAGPGGLTAAMILAHRGFDVTVYERETCVGGRNSALELGPYKFYLGPTFLMMKYILDEVFELAGRRTEDCLDAYELDPMYVLNFPDRLLEMTTDKDAMRARLAEAFPGEEAGLARFVERESARFELMKPCLQKPYDRLTDMMRPPFTTALPHLDVGKSVYSNLGRYFSDDTLRICFSFQSKYLGMAPWSCPAAFTIIPYIEHAMGVYHVRGGLSEISEAMARVVREEGGEVRLGAPVRRVLVENGRATGIELEGGERVGCDDVVLNADFGHAMETLFAPGELRRWRPEKLRRKRFSCSTFMLYLGLDTLYQEPHHAIIFAKDYRRNIEAIERLEPLPGDFSVYVRNASITDPTLAPEGHSALYVLVPAPNARAGIDWEAEKTAMRRRTLDIIKARTSMHDIEAHIREECVITPQDWVHRGVYAGATFNLAHTLRQMLYFRPRNRFEDVAHCYLVGGGTHPGSGLPTIYESGRIAANLLSQAYGAPAA